MNTIYVRYACPHLSPLCRSVTLIKILQSMLRVVMTETTHWLPWNTKFIFVRMSKILFCTMKVKGERNLSCLNILNFSLFNTQRYCMASEELEYSVWVMLWCFMVFSAANQLSTLIVGTIGEDYEHSSKLLFLCSTEGKSHQFGTTGGWVNIVDCWNIHSTNICTMFVYSLRYE